ncbi:MAG: serine/threonine protein phosphatase [Ruminococcaceae bacterium]|nr:serine/threonine protein phosphatase [Oscillospiraceae bacterium]
MALFTISDLHLSLNTNKSMEVFGGVWKDYIEKLEYNWNNLVKKDDLVVIPGDISWETYLEDAVLDFKFLDNLNGQKIISKGNHDFWFLTVNKLYNFFNENNISTIKMLHNNFYTYKNVAICGTKGIDITKKPTTEEAIKIENREAGRLEKSILDAKKAGFDDVLVFMHYPPVIKEGKYNNNLFYYILKEYGIKKCYYGHLHSRSHHLAFCEEIDGILFELISSDYLNFTPKKIL